MTIVATSTDLVESHEMKLFMGKYGADGGDDLIVRHFQSDAFGIVGARNLVGLNSPLKKEKRHAIRSVNAMLKAFKLIFPEESILSISTGSDLGGESIIVVVTVRRVHESVKS